MVFFTCDGCGESLKKNQVEKHTYRCKSRYFSCIDCQNVFDTVSYREHIKCVSEDQKYGGANYVVKELKGEVKQNSWLERVSQAIDNVRDPSIKNLLVKIKGYSNIPRKEAKFINFLQNCLKVHDVTKCKLAWKAINNEAEKIKITQQQAAEEVKQ